MKNQIYTNAKALLKSQAQKLKSTSNDKGYIRQELNNNLDQMIYQINHYAMRETISQKQADLYALWLSNYTCYLHPKN
jgi:hypothetical protein